MTALGEYTDIGVTLDGHVAVVEIQRPPHNFFDFSLIGQIADAFDACDAHADVRAIVLAAQGKSFCAGANFGSGDDEGDDAFSEEGFNTVTHRLYSEGVRLFRARTPVVGAIHGAAVGGGLGLALVPDFRVGCRESRFSANFAKLGIHPGFGLTKTLPRVIGEQQAARMFMTGCRVGGEEALQLGLIDRLVEQSDVRAAAIEFAGEIAENAPLAVVSVRATLRDGLADIVARQTEHELKEQQWLRATEDAAEGIRAVSERRPGNFVGR